LLGNAKHAAISIYFIDLCAIIPHYEQNEEKIKEEKVQAKRLLR